MQLLQKLRKKVAQVSLCREDNSLRVFGNPLLCYPRSLLGPYGSSPCLLSMTNIGELGTRMLKELAGVWGSG